jgi:putative RNA 2'-phosphotransferase
VEGDEVATSRFLSYVLRHRPDEIGLVLDPSGWVEIGVLLARAEAAGRPIDPVHLDRVVANNDKQRFEVRDGRIRAAQGHSIEVDLQLEPSVPPDLLYHGTVERFVSSILENGLRPQSRHDVHLSADVETAMKVGSRRGAAVILEIDAKGMHDGGAEFRRSSNGVWLTAAVAPRWLIRR